MNIIALIKKIRETHPFTPHNQKQLLECAQLYGTKKEESISNLKTRSRELQETLFLLLEATRPDFLQLKRLAIANNAKLNGSVKKAKNHMPKDPLFIMKKKPAELYGNSLLEHIEGIITKTEKNPTYKQCVDFYQGARIWLIEVRNIQTRRKPRDLHAI
ncbi:MAG: hypothetical protein UV79_C0011G0016 [candidate division TM6 bacterium GW2011_GWF2_43_17]|nr:MAG: hypothetical protein UV79_C0011G0016 [candidate division TM6 bacterium GW2011_GWF2_43_17]